MDKRLISGLTLLFSISFLIGGFFWWQKKDGQFLLPTVLRNFERERPLEKYSFENLAKREYQRSELKLERVIKRETAYTSWLFSFQSDGKRVTGMANIPNDTIPDDTIPDRNPKTIRDRDGGAFPVIVMLRGYVDDEVYFTGLGTRKAAGVFAENGFVTLAPDFLGFGGSDSPSEDILEARFERPVTVLNLLASIKTLPQALHRSGAGQADPEKVFLWAHSNGGQIALSVLEIIGQMADQPLAGWQDIPTALWAPVTKGFPGSVLDYIGEMDDMGRKVTNRIFEFEKYYDLKEFSINTYFDQISAPLQVQQGGGDYLIKQEWTDEFVAKLKSLGKDITYYIYPGDDHNLKQNWDTAVAWDLEFFRKFLPEP